MKPTQRRTPKIKEFVHAPFICCPECGTENMGVLMVCDRHYVRRCTRCWLDRSIPLPVPDKKVIYLDQFVISNMMKELDPDRPPEAKGAKGGLYRTLFERLDRLAKLQLAFCPDSPVHDQESVVDVRYEKLRSVFRHLSHGISLVTPSTIFHAQLLRAFRTWWDSDAHAPPLERRFAFNQDFNVWHDRYRIELNYTVPGLAAALRITNAERTKHLNEVCLHWQGIEEFDHRAVYEGELASIVSQPWLEYLAWMRRVAAAQQGPAPTDLGALYPPESANLVTHMMQDLGAAGVDRAYVCDHLNVFFTSEAARSVSYARISALFWAGVAREVHAGRKPATFPRAGMFNDIDMVAAYAPFCDSLFVDQQIAILASQGELKNELAGTGRLFSLHEGGEAEFLGFLDAIEGAAPPKHLSRIAEVYGTDWPTPYLGLLSKTS
jgi:hypothetical protein